METRKVQTVGNGTYTVSLPKEWAESQGVDAGDTVTLHEHIDGVLAVQTRDRTDDGATVAVRIEAGDATAIERTLHAAYTAGVREVILERDRSFSAERRRVVDRVARGRIGMSVTEESDTDTTVRMLLNSEEVSVGQSVRQLGFVVRSMHRDAVEALASADAAGGKSTFDSRDEQADRLSAMIERSVTRGTADLAEVDALGTSRSELFEAWTAMRELIRVREAAAEICAAAERLDAPTSEPRLESCREIGRAARDIVSDGVSVVLDDAGVAAAGRALDDLDGTRERLDAFDRDLAGADADAADVAELRCVSRRLRRTAECGGNVAEVGIRRAIRRGEPISGRRPEQPSR